MNTVICYLTALAMQVVGINMAHESDSLSSLNHLECKVQTINKTNSYPSETTEKFSSNFFEEEVKPEKGKIIILN